MTLAIIQARMGSTRLPGKVLRPLAGKPMLQHVIERVNRAKLVDETLVATSDQPADREIEEFCASVECPCFRGDENDVLDRYYQSATQRGADVVVRITSDCPLIDPDVIDQVVAAREQHEADYASNIAPTRTFPRGLDTEVFRFDVLERCWREAPAGPNREHVTSYIYGHPERFRVSGVTNDSDASAHRWTVDTPEDYALLERIYAHFGNNRFGWGDVLSLLAEHPEWSELNAHVEQKVH